MHKRIMCFGALLGLLVMVTSATTAEELTDKMNLDGARGKHKQRQRRGLNSISVLPLSFLGGSFGPKEEGPELPQWQQEWQWAKPDRSIRLIAEKDRLYDRPYSRFVMDTDSYVEILVKEDGHVTTYLGTDFKQVENVSSHDTGYIDTEFPACGAKAPRDVPWANCTQYSVGPRGWWIRTCKVDKGEEWHYLVAKDQVPPCNTAVLRRRSYDYWFGTCWTYEEFLVSCLSAVSIILGNAAELAQDVYLHNATSPVVMFLHNMSKAYEPERVPYEMATALCHWRAVNYSMYNQSFFLKNA